jgi:glycosyltransferase involved in cell wall biosynthesis
MTNGAAPLVSVITPTYQRHSLLPLIWKCVSSQEVADIEWLVLDDSPSPSPFMQGLADPRVRYEHRPQKLSIGTKRNLLVERARGAIVAQFDDDDYYAGNYLSCMVNAMRERNADFVKLFGFFLYSKFHSLLGYWDTTVTAGPHFQWTNGPIRTGFLDEGTKAKLKGVHLGFGFSYVFKKRVWEASPFPDRDWDEDGAFARKALERFNLVGLDDRERTCLHILHVTNTSQCFPQYAMPAFLTDTLFPHAREHLAASLR